MKLIIDALPSLKSQIKKWNFNRSKIRRNYNDDFAGFAEQFRYF